jgi:hypothetical protein
MSDAGSPAGHNTPGKDARGATIADYRLLDANS